MREQRLEARSSDMGSWLPPAGALPRWSQASQRQSGHAAFGWKDQSRGLAERFVALHGARMLSATVTGVTGQLVRARYAFLEACDGAEATAAIDVSTVLGPRWCTFGREDPLETSSQGLGELLGAALGDGARRIVLACDDSLACDGGVGMARALGARALDRHSWPVGSGAGALRGLARVDLSTLDPRLKEARIDALAPLSCPLLGPRGMAATAAQRWRLGGAQLQTLNSACERLASVAFACTGVELDALPSAGACGGLAAGLVAWLGARLAPSSAPLARPPPC
jgi:glycerate 2-kinase